MRADLHVHTFYSYDSSASPKEMVDAAIKRGINCLAICDHTEIRGVKEAIEYTKDRSFLIIPGIEIKSSQGDILGLNIKEIIPNKLSAKETIKKIKEAGGMAIIPHPFGWFCAFKGNLEELKNDIDGIEVLNGLAFGPGNKKALKLVKKYNLPFTAGSDAHSPEFVGRVFLEIPGENLQGIEEILEKIKKREVKIGGEGANYIAKIIDHSKRGLTRIKKNFDVTGKKR